MGMDTLEMLVFERQQSDASAACGSELG